jgi:hypothetical protein
VPWLDRKVNRLFLTLAVNTTQALISYVVYQSCWLQYRGAVAQPPVANAASSRMEFCSHKTYFAAVLTYFSRMKVTCFLFYFLHVYVLVLVTSYDLGHRTASIRDVTPGPLSATDRYIVYKRYPSYSLRKHICGSGIVGGVGKQRKK